jgi:hypothetical protein
MGVEIRAIEFTGKQYLSKGIGSYMKNIANALRCFFIDRTARTLMLTVLLLVIMGSSRPEKNRGLYPDAYWARKSGWEKCADMVLAGDSRVLIALSPMEMQKYFPGTRIYNYGFGSVWFSKEYMESVKDLLDPKSEDKTIIMGISPHSLLIQDVETSQFYRINNMSDRERFMETYLGGLEFFFSPLSFKEALKGILPSMADYHVKKHFFLDGWVAIHKEPDSMRKTFRNYRMYYEEQKVDPGTIENIISFIEECVGQGIKIYGFVPPTCREMYEFEAAESGFDEEDFIRRFEDAGGVWIYVDPVAYHSFDGSHLQDDSAIQLTNDLCEKIIKKWALKSGIEN